MNIEKIKEIIKNKKVQAISGAVAGALIIAVAGTMILHNKNIENNNVAIEKNIEDKTSEDDVLEETNEELTVENTVEDKEITENTDEHIHDENCNHDNENSTSQEEESTTESNSNKSNVENIVDNKASNSSSNSTSNNTSNSTSNNNINNSNTNKNEHTHSWVEVYKDVYHAEEGHYENVLVKEAWTESIPVYEEKWVAICNGCGKDITSDPDGHMKENALVGNYSCGSWRGEYKQIQTGTNTITHDAVYEQKWVVDKQAWTEKVLSGYKCSSCGATK